MEKYIVEGMTCAACQARVEKAVSKVDGVQSCAVSLLTNSMGVEGSADPKAIMKAVQDAGYSAKLQSETNTEKADTNSVSAEEEALEDHETPKLKKRLWYSLGFLVVLMYITMGHGMLGLPLPSFLNHNHIGLGLTQMFLTLIVMVINKKFFISGFKSFMHGSPNMDTLVALGSSVSFVWSVYVLYVMTVQITDGVANMELMPLYHSQLYFESAAMILVFITIGKMLEAKSKGKTTDALKSLMKLAPKKATIIRDGIETIINIDEVKLDDIFVVKPGESIPVDGVIISGDSSINESALTGESVPVDKSVNDTVSAGTLNISGYLQAKATHVGKDTTLSKIIQMVSDAAATKAPIAKIADQISAVFVPTVIVISIIMMIGWLLAGASFVYALERAISVLVISCPCALGLATPVAIMVGNGLGFQHGILFKTSEALEEMGKMNIIALDKTGTITTGQPTVKDIYPIGDMSKNELLQIAYSVEQKSEHPFAKAIVEKAQQENIQPLPTEQFKNVVGSGIEATLNNHLIQAGSMSYIRTIADIPSDIQAKADEYANNGKTPLFFAQDGKLIGMISAADTIKEDSYNAITKLKKLGMQVVMLTGDNERTANAIAKVAGVDRVVAGVKPDGKEAVISELQKQGKVAMVGDGINDAPALTKADIGIAIGAGTDVAIDSADIVLSNSTLTDVVRAVRLSRATLRNVKENLFWAFFYNLICIPLAAGLFGLSMNPMFGAAAMALSSVTVCMNALRLNLFKIDEDMEEKHFQREKHIERKEEKQMEKKIMIEGMMCGHCEKAVKNALEKIDGVTSAEVSHVSKQAIVTLNKEVPNEELRKAVEAEDYTVTGIE